MGISKFLIALSLAAIAVWFMPQHVQAQNCGCSSDLCCSQYGYCGTGDAYCGTGCQSGPCYSTTAPSPSTGTSVSDIVSDSFFNGIIGQAASDCAGKSFYTRQAFLDAVSGYSGFANDGSIDDNKREIAAFFAHVTQETGHFCYIEEIDKATYCDTDPSYAQYPCNPDKQYYGRGPLQLTWNYNYCAAGNALGFDGLNAPETVATSVSTSFNTALWYWMQNVHSVIGQGFGATINAINGAVECNGGPGASAVQSRVTYYKDYCTQFGVSPGDNLTC